MSSWSWQFSPSLAPILIIGALITILLYGIQVRGTATDPLPDPEPEKPVEIHLRNDSTITITSDKSAEVLTSLKEAHAARATISQSTSSASIFEQRWSKEIAFLVLLTLFGSLFLKFFVLPGR